MALVQQVTGTWPFNSQSTAKVYNLPAAATVGNVVVVVLGYTHDAINTVSGLGATWTQYQSRDGASADFESCEIWVGKVVTAGTAITVTPNPSFSIDGGCVWIMEHDQLSGAVLSSSLQSAHVLSSSNDTAHLTADTNDLYLGFVTFSRAFGTATHTDSPGAFDARQEIGSPDGANALIGGYRYSQAAGEVVHEAVTWSVSDKHVSVAIVLQAAGLGTPVVKPEASTELYSNTTYGTINETAASTSLLSNTGMTTAPVPSGSAFLLSNAGVVRTSSAEASTSLYSDTVGTLPVPARGSTYLYSDTVPASVPGAEASTWLYSDTTVVTVDVAEVSVEVARISGTAAGQLSELDTVVLRAPEIPAGQVAELDAAVLRAPLVASGQAAAVWVTVIRPPGPPVDLDLAVFSAAVRAEADVRSRVHDLGGP